MVFLGIDPGASGAMVAIFPDTIIRCRFSETDADLSRWIEGNIAGEDCVAMFEAVHSSPQMGVSSSFKFGDSNGFIRGLLVALRIPFDRVSPQKWQREFGLISRGRKIGLSDTEKKNRNKAKAQELFPNLDFAITHKEADALLIAEYCRRTTLIDGK